MSDPYKVLNIAPTASDDEVKHAYRELARKYHPDNYHDNPLADLAQEKMKEINEAYEQIQRQRRLQLYLPLRRRGVRRGGKRLGAAAGSSRDQPRRYLAGGAAAERLHRPRRGMELPHGRRLLAQGLDGRGEAVS